MRVVCDFDGTITRQDTTLRVLEELADPQWRPLEDAWVAGKIGGAECMRGQVALIGGSDAELDAVLAGAELDPGFPDFVAWCEARGLPLSIVSDGVDAFIAQILARHGLDRLPVTANRLTGAAGRRGLEHPPRPVDCESGAGVCKCAAAATDDSDIVVFVGDGRSDFCVATRADILFAKGALAAYATAQGKAYYSFDTFHDVRHALAQLAADGAAMPGDAALV